MEQFNKCFNIEILMKPALLRAILLFVMKLPMTKKHDEFKLQDEKLYVRNQTLQFLTCDDDKRNKILYFF